MAASRLSNRAERGHGAADSEAEQIDSSSQGRREGRGAYDDDFEEVGLLGRERGTHGCGGAARRGEANPRGGVRRGFWSREAAGGLSKLWCGACVAASAARNPTRLSCRWKQR